MKNCSASFSKFSLLGLLFLFFLTFFYFHLYQYLNFESIKNSQAIIEYWTSIHYTLVVTIYIITFSILIACAIPCATFYTLLGGFLFGTIAVIYAVIGTTLGGIILFYAVRTSIGWHIAEKSTGWIKRMEYGFKQNAFNYLVMLRFVPIFPCWLSNITAGALNVPFKTFVIATVIGVFPSTLIYVLIGRGFDKLLTTDPTSMKQIFFSPSIFFPLLALALLCLVPIFYKTFKK